MKYTEYHKILAQQDKYYTSPDSKSSIVINPTLRFYLYLTFIVFSSNYKTKRKIYDRYNWVASSQYVMNSLEKVGVKIQIEGMKNFQTFDGPAVFISNHMSSLETMVLPAIINPKKLVCFITKMELNEIPLFGPINKARHPIVVGRSNPREDLKIVLEDGKKRLNEGRSIIIFPQKTRSDNFDPKSFNTLGIKLAKNSNVPVVPIALLTDAWGNGKKLKDFGKIDPQKPVKFAFGKPLSVRGNGSEQHTEVIEFIRSKFIEWGKQDRIIS
jgi:1-acyl-sn-glycerol-3-phosphate acyltransferase